MPPRSEAGVAEVGDYQATGERPTNRVQARRELSNKSHKHRY